jgi:ATP-dependent RNA helicase RhlE
VNKLNQQLMKSGIRSDVIHGNKSQSYRTKAINQFKKGKVKILVATDVASRGIDIKGVTHVINYQLPQTMDSYIHRIGRTGRADAVGTAYTFVN